ncbi:YkgJ family cysteine cluster protein [Piscinibacter sakaiensis]|uniref:YkgJ family cysteine cluster protein n=1 Tax=Piscinibacter sakaiensis TaxID=1547922 RepID=UPI003AAC10AE
MSDVSPCTTCGACCATYRVSFYWAEAEQLPAALTRPLGRWYACMSGTQLPRPRCDALHGELGAAAACAVYEQRPSPCRELQPGDDKCQRARLRHGLAPLPVTPSVPVEASAFA